MLAQILRDGAEVGIPDRKLAAFKARLEKLFERYERFAKTNVGREIINGIKTRMPHSRWEYGFEALLNAEALPGGRDRSLKPLVRIKLERAELAAKKARPL
jgi:hypothetical protein